MISYTQQLYGGTQSSSSNSRTAPVNTKYVQEATFFLDITAVSGTSPTIDVTIKIYDRISDKWYLLATFIQKSSVSTDVGYVQYGLGERIAVDWTIGGTDTPTFTFAVNSTQYANVQFEPEDVSPDYYLGGGGLKKLTLAVDDTIKIEYCSENSSGTARIRNARISLLKL